MCLYTQVYEYINISIHVFVPEAHASLPTRSQGDRVPASEENQTGPGRLRVAEGDWTRSVWGGDYVNEH